MNGVVYLAALRMRAQQRSDMENNPAVSTPEWNDYISNSYKELYDLLISAYGNDYYMALAYQFNVSGSATYALPDGTPTYQLANNAGTAPAFYKVSGVDLQYSGSPTGFITLRNFEFIDRNKYFYPNTATNYAGRTNLRYRIVGNSIWFTPTPSSGQLVQLWYAPEPSNLQLTPVCNTTLNSAVIQLPAGFVGDLSVGMNAYTSLGIPVTGSSYPTILSINTGLNQVTLSVTATSTLTNIPIQFWTDAATVDGIAGWDEYVVIDAAIKAGLKQENDISGLILQKKEMRDRIDSMAQARDQGQASHVSDALALNGGYDDWGDGFGGGGFGGGGF